MYPLIRLAKEMLKFRRAPELGLTDTHVSTHICWPWDIDPWMELNNGRTLTLFDLGRLPMGQRMGLSRVLRENGWGLAVAGNSTRYRRRIRAFERFTMLSRNLGWDERFFYIEQSMWRRGECHNQMLLRGAITSGSGIVAPARVFAATGHGEVVSPELPAWVAAWIAADVQRPWPPEIPADARDALRE
ncbi:MAG: acyl-CoA thioesterase [Paracoccus sp. (in: a-proteobacteria)]|nr:acyl-CoA thioesterase [Paracoccus sp. (in: a-proteobacteria)]